MVHLRQIMLEEFFLIDWLYSGDKCHEDHLNSIAEEVGLSEFAKILGLEMTGKFIKAFRDKTLLPLYVLANVQDGTVLVRNNGTWRATTKKL